MNCWYECSEIILVVLNLKQIACFLYFNPLPDNISSLSKLKAFAHNKSNVASMVISEFVWVEHIVGKRENAGYQHFLLFPQCFQSFPSQVN